MRNRIYAYTVVGKDNEPWERSAGESLTTGHGLIKVGQTTKGTARARIKQQLGTAYPDLKGVQILLDEPAVRVDGTEYSDHDVHAALVAAGIHRIGGEWFEATLDEVKAAIATVVSGTAYQPTRTQTFGPRPEQQAAIDQTAAYFRAHTGTHAPKFLWNAKMRFGKTFATYELAKEMGWKHVLVLTFKPAVATAWHDDLVSHVDFDGWRYVDKNTPDDERDEAADHNGPVVWFASLQDLGGRDADGNIKSRNEVIHLIDWDAIVLDEYHFGAWRDSARALYDPVDATIAETEEPDDQITVDEIHEELAVHADHYLYLSGTPFRAITEGEFTEDAIFNWTYIDEQREKANWHEPDEQNPYLSLPQMQMYTYDMGAGAAEYAEDGEFAGFSLNETFKATTKDSGSCSFERPDEVAEFLELLRGKLSDQMKLQVQVQDKPPFPYEAHRFKSAVKHSVWYLPSVASCFAMADMLRGHPYFSQFEVVVAAGNKAGQGAAALPPVEAAIAAVKTADGPGSITLSCGKLMTGVTVREWGAIFMLRSLKSPESYFQAAFRVQSPWAHRNAEGHLDVHKSTCYVFEFDPNRALSLVAEYGSKLATTGETTSTEAIGELINYLPIFGFTGGAMTALDAKAVLDWATAGIGAAALARRWNSPLLVDVNERTLAAVLNHPDLMETLSNIEDFRSLVDNAAQVITNTKDLKKAKRDQGGKLDPDQKKQQSETASKRKEIREKLQKFLAKIPVFMYVTDFREETLKDVIESLDSDLFERVTGLTVGDFRTLNEIGLFNAQHLNHAIYQFKRFEAASLDYALTPEERERRHANEQIGLWDTVEPGDAS
ncbi:GIY-YIG nuclease family protein [Gordonia polyisoprenivorans]|uniref:GIY-YIG nuclease family protein n=1 Tax=Gordonia polyisoprenivorans TaxID=84595 RepID=UPI00223449F1|nr:GIY-YIG nuclease family protein [Gordonia polyisoprenivorans]